MSCFGCKSKISPSDYIDHSKNVYKIFTPQTIIYTLGVLPDGSVVSGGVRDIKVWDIDRKVCIATLSNRETYLTYVKALVVLADGLVASGYDDHKIRLWDARTGRCVKTLSGHKNSICALATLQNGYLASTEYNGRIIKVWNVKNGRCISNLSGLTDSIWALAKLSNGQLLSGDDAGAIHVWDVNCCENKQRMNDKERVCALAGLPNGLLASGLDNGSISLWNPEKGSDEGMLLGHLKKVRALAILADGRLASGSEDATIRIWNLSSLLCEATLSGHEKGVNALTLLPDGRLASGSSDQTIRVWDIKSQRKIFLKSNLLIRLIVFDPFQKIENELIDNLEIILRNKNKADRAFFPSSYINEIDIAIEAEVRLLTSYFSRNLSIDAFQAYLEFVKRKEAYYKARSSARWGRYPTSIITKNAFTFEGFHPDFEVFCHSGFKAANISGMLLLLCLPHLNIIEKSVLNERRDGFTLLHYLMMEPENDLSVLCVSAILIMGGDPHIPGKGKLNNIEMENQTPIHIAKRFNKLRYFAALTNGADIQTIELPENTGG